MTHGDWHRGHRHARAPAIRFTTKKLNESGFSQQIRRFSESKQRQPSLRMTWNTVGAILTPVRLMSGTGRGTIRAAAGGSTAFRGCTRTVDDAPPFLPPPGIPIGGSLQQTTNLTTLMRQAAALGALFRGMAGANSNNRDGFA
jgi:hypothetical protein